MKLAGPGNFSNSHSPEQYRDCTARCSKKVSVKSTMARGLDFGRVANLLLVSRKPEGRRPKRLRPRLGARVSPRQSDRHMAAECLERGTGPVDGVAPGYGDSGRIAF